MMIGIGCIVKLSCTNEYIGSFLFSIGLFVICNFDLYLYTGKIGFAFTDKGFSLVEYIIIWTGNLMGILCIILPFRFVESSMNVVHYEIMNCKIGQTHLARMFFSVLCGILMFIAVDNSQKSNNGFYGYLGIVMCVMTFILSKFEHSIADMGYSILYINSILDFIYCSLYILEISVGNSFGAILMQKLCSKK